MTKKVFTIALMVSLALTSCNQSQKQETKNEKVSKSKTEKETDSLIGSWVEPNPINENEFQGIEIKENGIAESINMATLIYKKWWKEADKLVLVAESVGNGTTSLDTIKYEIVKLNEKELELKDNDYIIKYKKQ
jgi:ADP-ribosylglycohydrolase